MTTMDADSVQVLPDALRFRATPSRPLRWSREAEFGPLEEVVVPALQIHAVAREGKTGVRVGVPPPPPPGLPARSGGVQLLGRWWHHCVTVWGILRSIV